MLSPVRWRSKTILCQEGRSVSHIWTTGGHVAEVTYEKVITDLVVIDPYNDFISEGGKLWDRLRGVAEANGCVPHMSDVLNAARNAGIRVFYALHHRYRAGDYET